MTVGTMLQWSCCTPSLVTLSNVNWRHTFLRDTDNRTH